MEEQLPVIYLGGLLLFLGGLAVFVIFQIFKSQRAERRFNQLQKKLQKDKGTAEEYYELASLYLDKKLFVQAVNLLEKALKSEEKIEPQNQALIYNALGFTYFSQEQFDLAIRNYKEAIKRYPEYTIAINNLANVYERKQMIAKAVETYEETLKHDPKNETAKNRSESLRKRLVESK